MRPRLPSWLRDLVTPTRPVRRDRHRFVPSVQVCEDRLAPATFAVTTAADVVNAGDGVTSLREAVAQAAAAAGDDTVTFGPGVFNGEPADVITLGSTLALSDPSGKVTIDGTAGGATGVTVSGNHAVRVAEVAAGTTAELRNLTVTAGVVSGPSANGAGIYNAGTLTLTGATVSDNFLESNIFTRGAGVFNGGSLTVVGSAFSNNQAKVGQGGGVYNAGSLEVIGSVFDSSTSDGDGGAVYNAGTFTLANSTVSNSSTYGRGGGVFSNGTFTVTDSTFSGNTAGSDGGGIYNVGGTATIAGTKFTDNSANGGGALGVHSVDQGEGAGIDRRRVAMSMTDATSQQNVRRNRWRAWFTGAVLALACAVAYLLGPAATRDDQAKRALAVSPAKLDFGEVWETERLPWTIPIQNTTSERLDIMGFASSCSCVAIHPNSLVIPAGGTAEVQLTLNLVARANVGGDGAGGADGGGGPPSWPFEAQIVPHVRSGIPYQEGWTLKGRVRKPFHIEPRTLDFGDGVFREGSFAPRSVDVVSYVPDLKDVRASVDATQAVVQLEPVNGIPGKYRVAVTPSPSLPSGPFRFQVRISGTAADRTEVPGFVSARGEVLRDVYSQPETVVLGARPTEETCEETLLLLSRSGKAFTVRRVQTDGEGLTVQEAGQVAVGKLFRISQRITTIGHREGKVRFFVTSDGAEPTEIPITVAYHGLPSGSPGAKAVSPGK